jgi:IclR family transcriptional regulator, acetate operon repressor
VATPKNQSVIKAFKLLGAFRRPDEWLTSVELSRRVNLPAASGYRLIQTLEELGAIVRGPRGRYRPGMLLVSLSHNVATSEILRELSHPILCELANSLNGTVHMGVLEGGMVTYIAKVGTSSHTAVHTRVGSQLEAYSTGLGKVLLAALPDDALEAIIHDGDLVPLTPFTITNRAILRSELGQVRQQDYALDNEESSLNLCCVAVPVRDGDGTVIAAISASDVTQKMTGDDRIAEVRDALLAAASAIGQKLYPAPRFPSRAEHRELLSA